jgi:hypothetical protein
MDINRDTIHLVYSWSSYVIFVLCFFAKTIARIPFLKVAFPLLTSTESGISSVLWSLSPFGPTEMVSERLLRINSTSSFFAPLISRRTLHSPSRSNAHQWLFAICKQRDIGIIASKVVPLNRRSFCFTFAFTIRIELSSAVMHRSPFLN